MTSHKGERLSLARLLIFASPATPIAALGLPIAVHLPAYYAEYTALTLAQVGFIMMLTKLWDVITDPMLGWMSDRSQSRHGRRRPWIVLSVPFVLVSVYMVFLPPEDAGSTYLLAWLIVMYVGWTMLTISHMSWAAELSDDYDERSRIQGAREGGLILGAFLVLAIPAILSNVDSDTGSRDQLRAMGLFVIILLPIAVFFCVRTIPERTAPPPPDIPLWTALKTMLKNRPLRTILIIDLFGGISAGTVTFLFIPLTRDALGLNLAESSLMLLVYFVSGVVFVPVIVKAAYRFGKHRTLAIASLINAFTVPFIFVIPSGDLLAIVLLWGVLGINLGAGSLLIRAITADIVDLDQIETGAQRTGVFYALINMTTKIGMALAVGVAGIALEGLFGYDIKSSTHSAEAITGLKIIYVSMPVLVAVIAFFMLWNFPIDKGAQARLRKAIADREALLQLLRQEVFDRVDPATYSMD